MHTFTVMKSCNDKPGRKEKTKNAVMQEGKNKPMGEKMTMPRAATLRWKLITLVRCTRSDLQNLPVLPRHPVWPLQTVSRVGDEAAQQLVRRTLTDCRNA
jgi:hypothetical protein